jgi:hypothetical protein
LAYLLLCKIGNVGLNKYMTLFPDSANIDMADLDMITSFEVSVNGAVQTLITLVFSRTACIKNRATFS